MRLIDADNVIRKLRGEIDEITTGATLTLYPRLICKLVQNVIDYLQKVPTVDAVEVVRCKDCVFENLSTCPMCYIEQHTLQFLNHDPDFYCAAGERRCDA